MGVFNMAIKKKIKKQGDMNMLKRILSTIMISMLVLGNLSYALAYEEVVNDRVLKEDNVNQDEYRDDKDKVWEAVKLLLEAEKDALEAETENVSLEKQYERVVEAGNAELAAQIEGELHGLKAELSEAKATFKANPDGKKAEYIEDEDKVWEEVKLLLEAEKDALEAEMENVSLEKQYENAVEAGDSELAELKAALDEAKATFKAKLDKMKTAIKTGYTKDELEDIAKTTRELEEKGMEVLPVENVLSKKGKFKFDVPPVIKEGRTLIPVRAISEGFGAQVAWDEEISMIIITNENTTIVLRIDDKIAEVNDQDVVLDVPAEIMNSRTVVPLRFIGESFGLDIEWDESERIIEIE